MHLMPDWRGVDPARMDRPLPWKETVPGGDWKVLIVPGKNGLLTAVAGLAMWGRGAVKANQKSKEDWLEAVIDATCVLSGLREYMREKGDIS